MLRITHAWGVARLAHPALKAFRPGCTGATHAIGCPSVNFRCVSRQVVSFQITVLKVLAGHPGGRASVADLKHAVAILISSGSDWTDRTKRLAARAPGLDIFSQLFVLRDEAGWQITDAGLALLASVESPIHADNERAPEPVATPAPEPVPATPPIRLVGVDRRGPRRRVRPIASGLPRSLNLVQSASQPGFKRE
jgi:hypothetical protein